MDVLKKIFVFTLLLFPLGEIIRIDFGNGLVIKPLDIGIGIVVLLWLSLKLFNRQKITQPNFFLPIALFASVGLFSLIINSSHLFLGEWLISFAYLLRWFVYAGIFFVVSDFDDKFKKVISNILIIIGSLIVGIGYVQYFFYPFLRNLRYLGWDEHMYRMFSVFFDPNFAGAFFVLFFLFLVTIFLKRKTASVGLLSVLTLGAVFLTFSRSALVMLIVSSSLLFVLMDKKKLILLLLIFVFIVLSASSKYFNIANINLFRAVSSEARIETAKNAIRIIKDHPIFGVGFNAYRYTQFMYRFRKEVNINSHADSAPDNSFLFVMATTGIIGFILYLFIWFRVLKIASTLVIASVLGIFVDSMFINSLFYPFIMLWLWIVIALKKNNLP